VVDGKAGAGLPHSKKSEKPAGQASDGGAEAAAERREESVVVARGVGVHVQQLRGNTQRAAEQIRIHPVKAGEALQRGHLPLKRGVAEGQLILLRLIRLGNSLLPGEFVGQLGEACGVARTRDAILRGLLERIESARERALGLVRDGRLVRWAETGIVQDALILREQEIADLLLLVEKLLVQCIGAGKLLLRQLPCLVECARHEKPPEKQDVNEIKEVKEVKEVKEPENAAVHRADGDAQAALLLNLIYLFDFLYFCSVNLLQ